MSSASCDLFDVNVLLAAVWPSHQFHSAVHRWLAARGDQPWSTCAVTQMAFVRLSCNAKVFKDAVSPTQAIRLLERTTHHARHVYWAECPPIARTSRWDALTLVGHQQITDAYLLTLAQHHGGRLATFDRGIPELLPDPVERSRCVELIAMQ